MELREPRPFVALCASMLLHGTGAALVMLHAMRAPKVSFQPPAEAWSGDTIDITALIGAPPSVEPAEAAPVPPSPPLPVAPAAATPLDALPRAPNEANAPGSRPIPEPARDPDWLRAEDRREESAPGKVSKVEPEDEHAALARKIMEFRPKVSSRGPADEGRARAAAPAASTFGVAGPSGPARQLGKAFTRAIPAANSHDRAWNRLPLGPAGTIRVRVTVGGDGGISSVTVLDERPVVHMKRLVERTLLSLKGGRFVLSGAPSGSQKLRIELTLSERPLAEGPLELGFESPRPGKPGRAYFQLASGRFVEAKVVLE